MSQADALDHVVRLCIVDTFAQENAIMKTLITKITSAVRLAEQRVRRAIHAEVLK